MIHLNPHFARLDLWVLKDAIEGFDGAARDAGIDQSIDPVLYRFCRGYRFDARHQIGAIANTLVIRCEGWITGKFGRAGEGAERPKLPIVAGCDDHMTVRCRAGIVGHNVGVGVADPSRRLAGNQVVFGFHS